MHHARIDRLSYQDSPIHRLDGRVKLLAVMVFSVFVISLPSTSVSILACFALWPFVIIVIAGVPLRFVLGQIALTSPFVLVLAASSIFYDHTSVSTAFGPFSFDISAGLLRCLSIMGKFAVTMAALMSLVATTRFSDLLEALSRLRVPSLLITQLGFLYRYIFMLTDKAHNILRARAGRKLGSIGFAAEAKTAAAMLGTLLIDSIDTAEKVNMAMCSRGFTGRFRSIHKTRIRKTDLFFAAALVIYLLSLHFLEEII